MKAIVLLSGGLDSCVVLALAKEQSRDCHALTFDYGQRHHIELERAKALCEHYQVPQTIIHIDHTAFSKSSLVHDGKVPRNRTVLEDAKKSIPNTYVPARNTIFLAHAVGLAEQLDAGEIHVGINCMDAQPYPDCRPAYLQAMQNTMNLCTKQACEDKGPRLVTPLLHKTKVEIIQAGLHLNAPLDITSSCYDPMPGGEACGECLACRLRDQAFMEMQQLASTHP